MLQVRVGRGVGTKARRRGNWLLEALLRSCEIGVRAWSQEEEEGTNLAGWGRGTETGSASTFPRSVTCP